MGKPISIFFLFENRIPMKLSIKIITIIALPFLLGKTIHLILSTSNSSQAETSIIYPEHIAGAYTGGFGEQSCHSCHFDYELNQPEGELSVTGIEDAYEPGREYTVGISVKREDMNRAGFQMTARFEDGTQAGTFELDEELTTTPNIENKISYVQHGIGNVEAEGGEKKWQVKWLAPDATGPVVFNIAANAANGDASEFGDWIYLKEIRIQSNP